MAWRPSRPSTPCRATVAVIRWFTGGGKTSSHPPPPPQPPTPPPISPPPPPPPLGRADPSASMGGPRRSSRRPASIRFIGLSRRSNALVLIFQCPQSTPGRRHALAIITFFVDSRRHPSTIPAPLLLL